MLFLLSPGCRRAGVEPPAISHSDLTFQWNTWAIVVLVAGSINTGVGKWRLGAMSGMANGGILEGNQWDMGQEHSQAPVR